MPARSFRKTEAPPSLSQSSASAVSYPTPRNSTAPCEDAEGNAYTVIVWRPLPGLNLIEYTLDDGRPVKFVNDRLFEIVATGVLIIRCQTKGSTA